IGMAINMAPMRSMIHRVLPMMAKACWPSTTIWVAESIAGLPDQMRYALEQLDGEFDQMADQQAAEREQRGGEGRGLGDEGDGRFIELGGRLDHAHHHT